ncbi:MAG: hypothetical protein IJX57_06140, partial [Clostridia bacterium]|nr:hypothetical protein [Clostridia bacterium]
PLECETDAVYYESDFGNANGTLDLNGEFKFGEGIETKPLTRISANITFKEGGYLNINTDNGMVPITYDNDIRICNENITLKDNMEFTLKFDKENSVVTCVENDNLRRIVNCETDLGKITSISGENVTVEYVGISYPDKTKVTIVGPDKVSSLSENKTLYDYTIEPEYYYTYKLDMNCSVLGVDGAFIHNTFHTLALDKNTSGKATLCVEYNGVKTYKEIEIIPNPKITEWHHDGNTLNLYSSKNFEITDVKDEFGNDLGNVTLKDFSSSDENVIKIDQNGKMTAVGKGKATISANAYTGIDNIVSVEYTVDQFYVNGVCEAETSYVSADLIENDNITYYQVTYGDGTKEKIEKTQIPASIVTDDGTLVIVYYNSMGKITSVKNQKVYAGDKIVASNGNKKVYLYANGEFSKITEANTTMDGYEIKNRFNYEFELAPVYKFTDIGDVKEAGKTLGGVFPQGYYNITLKKGETWRGDIIVNGFMVGNNVDQSDTDRKLKEGSLYVAEDIKVKNGEINLSMSDGSTLL